MSDEHDPRAPRARGRDRDARAPTRECVAQAPTRKGDARARGRERVALGDWQTPRPLADSAIARIRAQYPDTRAILEPTCGRGAFLVAAAAAFPAARLVGFDRAPHYIEEARAALGPRAELAVADCFHTDWDRVVAGLPEPLLVVGNPPWVTNASLGALGATNLPPKSNFKGEAGLAARTGRSNFDVSEWLILRLLAALRGRRGALAMLCKSTVARRVIEHAAAQGWALAGSARSFDAPRHFGAAVDACLMTAEWMESAAMSVDSPASPRWPVYADWDASAPTSHMGVAGGRVHRDVDAFLATRDLEGPSRVRWRSGIKHDCARVMEFTVDGGALVNGHGEAVDLEPDHLYPLLKGSDLASDRLTPRRALLVPQTRLGQATAPIAELAPRTWAYLQSHHQALAARRSSIYRGAPPYAIFGVGDYAFAPYKVAVSGLAKRLAFRVLRPHQGRPVVVDDTCYFLPCAGEAEALALAAALDSPRARAFFEARVFWADKRPITRALLGALALERLVQAGAGEAGA